MYRQAGPGNSRPDLVTNNKAMVPVRVGSMHLPCHLPNSWLSKFGAIEAKEASARALDVLWEQGQQPVRAKAGVVRLRDFGLSMPSDVDVAWLRVTEHRPSEFETGR